MPVPPEQREFALKVLRALNGEEPASDPCSMREQRPEEKERRRVKGTLSVDLFLKAQRPFRRES